MKKYLGLFIVIFMAMMVSAKLEIFGHDTKRVIELTKREISTFLDLTDTPSAYGSAGLCLKVNASAPSPIYFGTCSNGTGGGDITAVISGTGLTGGGDTGDVTLNLNTTYTDDRYIQNSELPLANRTIIDCHNITGGSDGDYCIDEGNSSFNKSLTDTLYAGIEWDYNQSDGSYNETYNIWAYNQSDGSYNSTYDATAYNMSEATFAMWNSTWDNSWVNVFAYNHTLAANESIYGAYGQFWYNMSDGNTNCTADQSCDNILYESDKPFANETTPHCDNVTGSDFDLCTNPDTTIGNCSGDQSCSNIIYDSDLPLANQTIIDCHNITGGSDGDYCVDADSGGGNPFDQDLNTTDNVTFQNITLGTSEGDHVIYFYEDGSSTGESFYWDDSLDRFRVTDEFMAGGPISAAGSVTASPGSLISTQSIYTTGSGDNLWLGNLTESDALFIARADGTVNATNITADYFIGDGSKLTNLPSSGADGNASSICSDNEVLLGQDATTCVNLNNTIDDRDTNRSDADIQGLSLNQTEADLLYLNLSGTNANQNINISPYNITTNKISYGASYLEMIGTNMKLESTGLFFLQNGLSRCDGNNEKLEVGADGEVTCGANPDTTGGWTNDSVNTNTSYNVNAPNISISEYLYLANGSAAKPSLTFTDDTDTGIYLLGENAIAIVSGGSPKFRVMSDILFGDNYIPTSDDSFTIGNSSNRLQDIYLKGKLYLDTLTTYIFGEGNNVTIAANDSIILDSSTVDITGNLTVSGFSGFVPLGGIIPWMKNATGTPSLPSNWIEMDGEVHAIPCSSPFANASCHYTPPDLNGENRFLRGNDTSGGTGGNASVNLTIANLPPHAHKYDKVGTSNFVQSGIGATAFNGYISPQPSTGASGNGTAHENQPQYYDVVYIMRILCVRGLI